MGINNLNEPITKLIELDLDGLSREEKLVAKEEAGKIIVDGINRYLDKSKSPVENGYFERKKADGERSILFEEGDLRDSITFKNRKGNAIEVGVFDRKEIPIAYNHNIGDTLPVRQFIPDEEEDFRKDIVSSVNRVIKDLKSGKEIKREKKQSAQDLFEAFTRASTPSDTGLFNFPTVGDLLRELEE